MNGGSSRIEELAVWILGAASAAVVTGGCTDIATAIASRCGRDNPHIDGSKPPPGLVVAVAVEGGTDVFSAAGFCVRAERADGTAFEALTDASGVATVPIDPAAGPWDVTAARYGFEAVSILGVDGPLRGALYTEPPGLDFGNEYDRWRVGDNGPVFEVEVSPPAGTDPGEWTVFDHGVRLDSGGGSFTEYFDMHSGAPPFELTAFSPQRGVLTMPPIARAARRMDVTLTGTLASPPAAVSTDVTIELPWPITLEMQPGHLVLRPCGHGAQRCDAPGMGTLVVSDPAQPTTKLSWHIDTFAAPMAPDAAVVWFSGLLHDGSYSTVDLRITARSFGVPGTIKVPDFGAARVDVRSLPDGSSADTTITAHGAASDRVAALLLGPDLARPNEARVGTAWRIFTYRGASLDARRLPRLPAGMKVTYLGNGPLVSGSAWILSGVDDAHPPWSSATLDAVATVVAAR